jgi:uncharacterized membrane protein YciS (DUF1049 family)
MSADGKPTGREAVACLSAVMFIIVCFAAAIAHKDFGFGPVGAVAFGIGVAIFWLIVGMWMMASGRRT